MDKGDRQRATVLDTLVKGRLPEFVTLENSLTKGKQADFVGIWGDMLRKRNFHGHSRTSKK